MKLGNLIRSSGPGKGLAQRVRQLFQGEPRAEYTFPHIVQNVKPGSPEDVAAVLNELTKTAEVEKILRVESPTTHGGIGDYSSAQEIPAEVYDFRADRNIRVRPENVVVIFRRKRVRSEL